MTSIGAIPIDWLAGLGTSVSPADLADIDAFVTTERIATAVYPPAEDVFAALRLTPLGDLRAVLVGQDPYYKAGQAHGLAFSVPDGIPLPPSLRNIRMELRDDLGLALPASGSLVPWARHGVLLLNTALTVRGGKPGSHAKVWASLTDALIRTAAGRDRPIAFLLWGSHAQAKAHLIDEARHVIVKAAHPSPQSAHHGFLGSRPFSTANRELALRGLPEVDWSLE